ncbi:MAG: sulfite exporter TauE/SafE family protein, partial [Acidimicrobiales bacterium]
MDVGPLRDALTLVAGLATGVMSASFGIGGATISTPAIRALGVSPLLAVGTTLPSILPGAVAGTLQYVRQGLVRWRAVAWAAPAGAVAAVAGSLLSPRVPGSGHLLMIATALLLGATSARIGRGNEPVAEAATRPRESPVLLAGAGAAAGLLSGLLGV